MKCKDCKHFLVSETIFETIPDNGTCHKRSPQIYNEQEYTPGHAGGYVRTGDLATRSGWPYVMKTDYCGEFESK